MPLLNIALTFFLVANPIGNSPTIIAVIKDFDFERQKKIMLRESILALLIAFFFQYFGKIFFAQLEINDYTLQISGGILLLIVALSMIFAPSSSTTRPRLKQEPLIVPIATPLISGPALLTIIMSYSKQEENNLKISLAIAISWIAVTAVLVAAPYLQRFLGRRGLGALEQLMGLFLAMMAIGMIVQGMTDFINLIELRDCVKIK